MTIERSGLVLSFCEQTDKIIDSDAALNLWLNAMSTPWSGKPVWIHGDLEVSNLLVSQNELAAVIDFGLCAVGDPACDLVMAWTLFDETARELFRSQLNPNDATWERGKAWALWKALFRLSNASETHGDEYGCAMRVVNRLLS